MTLSLTPSVAFDTAVLRVSGPDGYALSKRFAADRPVFADLLADADPGEVFKATRQKEPESSALADGRYRYELVVTEASGSRLRQSGTFQVEGGHPSRPPARSEPTLRSGKGPRPVVDRTGPSLRTAQPLTFADDAVVVNDADDDGLSTLGLRSQGFLTGFPDWRIDNNSGDLQFRFDGATLGSPLLTLEAEFQVGIGTTAPLQELHIDSADGGDIKLTGSGADFLVGISAVGDDFVIWDDDNGTQPFWIRPSSPLYSLVVHPNGVGVGTYTPAAKLHVVGSGIIEGDVALGSSRSIKHSLRPVDADAVLAQVRELPLFRWKYKDDPTQAPHLGPMAEDVHATFAVGRDAQHLSPADSAGLALAAIQGLDRRLDHELRELRAALAALADAHASMAAENRRLRERLEAFEQSRSAPLEGSSTGTER